MGKKKIVQAMPGQDKPYTFPSRFGTHSSMVVLRNEANGTCICKDEFGHYRTEISRIDNGLADPNRYRTSRLVNLFDGVRTDAAKKEEEALEAEVKKAQEAAKAQEVEANAA